MCMKIQRPIIGKDVPSMKNIIGNLPISDFKLYYRAVVSAALWNQHKSKQ